MQEIHALLDALKDLGSIQTEIQKIKEELSTIRTTPCPPTLVPEKQISTELNICTKTLRKYRECNTLPYVKMGRRIFYDRGEVLNHLREANRTDSGIRITSKLSRVKKRLFQDARNNK